MSPLTEGYNQYIILREDDDVSATHMRTQQWVKRLLEMQQNSSSSTEFFENVIEVPRLTIITAASISFVPPATAWSCFDSLLSLCGPHDLILISCNEESACSCSDIMP